MLNSMKRAELIFVALLLPLDFLAILAAGIAAYYARFHPYFVSIRPVIFDLAIEPYLNVIVPITVLWMVVFAFAGLYAVHQHQLKKELTRIILASSASMALVFAILFFSRSLFESRFIALAAWIFGILFVCLERVAIRGLQRSLLKFGIGEHRVVVIGDNKTSQALIREFDLKHRLGFHVVGHIKNADGNMAEKVMELKKRHEVDEVILAEAHAKREHALSLLALSNTEQFTFKYTADLFEAAAGKNEVRTYAGIPLVEVKKTPLDGWGAIYKRLFDIVGSLALIILTLPIQIVAAVAIKLDSRGRLLFSRLPDGSKTRRVGLAGKPFHYFKFRTMVEGKHFDRYGKLAHLDTRRGPLVKIKNDPRITRVGKILRKLSIDEFPEFYLVLLGRMSLVGPRPHLPEEVAKYKPHHRKVLTVKPGITGMAQISGRADLDFEDEVRLDTYYIEHWSPVLDLYILIKTPIVVLFRKGAY